MSRRKAKPAKPLGRGRVHRLADGRRIEVFEGPPLGDGMVGADVETVLAALQGFDPAMPWKKARDRVLPMLPRVRPLPTPELELVRAMLPPGILVGFGIDIGPAITFVTTMLLDRWRVEPTALAAAALANLRTPRDAAVRTSCSTTTSRTSRSRSSRRGRGSRPRSSSFRTASSGSSAAPTASSWRRCGTS